MSGCLGESCSHSGHWLKSLNVVGRPQVNLLAFPHWWIFSTWKLKPNKVTHDPGDIKVAMPNVPGILELLCRVGGLEDPSWRDRLQYLSTTNKTNLRFLWLLTIKFGLECLSELCQVCVKQEQEDSKEPSFCLRLANCDTMFRELKVHFLRRACTWWQWTRKPLYDVLCFCNKAQVVFFICLLFLVQSLVESCYTNFSPCVFGCVAVPPHDCVSNWDTVVWSSCPARHSAHEVCFLSPSGKGVCGDLQRKSHATSLSNRVTAKRHSIATRIALRLRILFLPGMSIVFDGWALGGGGSANKEVP